MENTEKGRGEVMREIHDLLETAAFSLETVRMALGIGRCARDPHGNLDGRLQSHDEEEREAGVVAIEALDHARCAFLELGHLFDQPEQEILGFELRFWSTFEWCWNRLFEASVRESGQQSLRSELIEASSRTAWLIQRLDLHGGRGDTAVT